MTVLEGLAALGPFSAVESHRPGAVPALPWLFAGELLSPSEPLWERITTVRGALAERGGLPVDAIEPRVAASAVHLGLAARFIAPALGAAVLGEPLDLRPGGMWWQDVTGGPVPLSVPVPSARTDAWERVLFDDLLGPLTSAVAGLVPVSARVLRGNVASGINSAAAQLARQRPDLAGVAWPTARRLAASPWLSGETHPPGPGFRRASCCLFYRLGPGSPAALCGDCVLAGRPGLV